MKILAKPKPFSGYTIEVETAAEHNFLVSAMSAVMTMAQASHDVVIPKGTFGRTEREFAAYVLSHIERVS